MGIGFTLALFCMATVREVFGAGSFMGMEIPFISDYKVPILQNSPGGFFVFGVLIALVNKLFKREPKKEFSCKGCPSAAFCTVKSGAGNKAEACRKKEGEEK